MRWVSILLFSATLSVASAQTFGDFTYSDNPDTDPITVTITDYPTSATGAVEIPAEIDGKPVTAIGPQAFALCAGIDSVTIPPSVTSIAAQAFFNCTALAAVDIPSSVTSIGSGAFFSCIALTSVTVPAGVTVLSDSVFNSCRGLTSITILGEVTSVGNSAFESCSGLTSLVIPATVTSLGTSAFRFCTGLTSMEIPSGVTNLQFGLFSDCTNLSSVTLPANLTTIGGSAFAKCTSLTSISTPGAATTPPSIVIPAAVTSLGTFVFAQCSSLTSVVIPAGVPSIGVSAFELCTSLITISIPSSVTALGNNAFERCTALISVTVNPDNPSYTSEGGVLFNKDKSTLITYPRGLAGPYTVPPTVTAIGANAFRFAIGVTSISLPATCTASGLESFAGCSSLTSFTVAPGGTTGFKSGTGPLYSFSGLSLVAYPGGLSGAFTIPSTVSTISESAFRYCGALTSVTFPNSIVTVRNTAFANCSQLTAATFEGNAPGTFGSSVFLSAATGFSVYFNSTSTGFTVPTWRGYPASAIGANAALVNWLLGYNLPANSDLKSDANGDGVSLLMAYALNLNPSQNLSGSLPQPVFAANQMSMSFYAGAGGVTYVVEVSPDLVTWETEGVSYSDLNQVRTATANRTPGSRFMRLVASY